MISKRVGRRSRASFRSLARYITGAGEKGEKVEHLWAVNCYLGGVNGIPELEPCICEIEAAQGLNNAAGSNRNYHLVLSFRDDRPPVEALKDIERRVADELGLAEHQRIAATHVDTESYHMHIAYNLVHPRKHTVHHPYRDYGKLERVCREVEAEYGLRRDRGAADNRGAARMPDRARSSEIRTWEQSFAGYLMEAAPRLDSLWYAAKTWRQLHGFLGEYGVELRPSGNGLALVDTAGTGEAVKASTLGRKFGRPSLEGRFGAFEPPTAGLRVEIGDRYALRPITDHAEQGRLWERYVAGREDPPASERGKYGNWRNFLDAEAAHDPLARDIIASHRQNVRELGWNRNLEERELEEWEEELGLGRGMSP